MTAFDDPKYLPTERVSVWRGLWLTIAAQPAIIISAIVAASLIIGGAFLICSADQMIKTGLAQLLASTRIYVFVKPQASRADAVALGERIKAMAIVDEAVLRPKEEAYAALVKDALLPVRDDANPLPDAWNIALKSAALGDADGSALARLTNARQALAALPNVDSVEVDLRWVQSIDAWRSFVRAYETPGAIAASGLFGLLLLAVSVLTGRASQSSDLVQKRALALVIGLVGLLSVVIAALGLALLSAIVQTSSGRWKMIVVPDGLIDVRMVVVVGFLAIAVMLWGATIGAIRR